MGASSSRASSGSNTAGSSSYSTSISAKASSAASRSCAATAATRSPAKRTRSSASTGTSKSRRPYRMPRTSAPVKTTWTPGTCCAREVSIWTIRACGKGLRRARPHRVPGSATSAVYCVAPVTFAGPSTLGVGWPMVVYDIFFPSPTRSRCPCGLFQNPLFYMHFMHEHAEPGTTPWSLCYDILHWKHTRAQAASSVRAVSVLWPCARRTRA